jgi:phage terminase large subunit-like protein
MRIDNQNPSFTNIPKTRKTRGTQAIRLYATTGRTLLTWQQRQIRAMEVTNKDGSWKYMVYCLAVSRRNGKGEILVAREMDGLIHLCEKICHTAHRTTTSHDAFNRLYTALKAAGYEEHSRKQKNMPAKSFFASKQYGLEHIEVTGGGSIDFRTRTNNGGLGEGFDLLVVDEAQEYTTNQQSALSYTVSSSKNPQTIITGTPPTVSSGGDVFVNIRNTVLEGKAQETGWAEWSTPEMVEGDKLNDPQLWKRYNPSYGFILTERKIRAELTNGALDFNIQRLGFWCTFNQKSEISETDWMDLKADALPELKDERYLGIKYGRDGVNCSLSIAAKTKDGRIFVEAIDCTSVRAGNGWLFDYINNPKVNKIVIDGASGQQTLADQIKEYKFKKTLILPTVAEIIQSNSMFEQDLYAKKICHMGQKTLKDIVTNCKKRLIGSKGGFGYASLVETQDISVMESMILAYWICAISKEEKKKQKVSY